MNQGAEDRPGPAIFYSLDCFGFRKTAHGRMQGEADINHSILESTYLLLHLVCFVHQCPIPKHLGSEPPVLLVDEGRVDPLCSRVLAEEDEHVGVRVRLNLIGAESRRRMSGLLEHRIPVPHRSPHHRVSVPSIFDEACGMEASFVLHLHGAKVGGHVVLEPSRASDDRDFVHYAAYLRTARPPRPLLPSPTPTSTSSSSSSARRRFFFLPRCDSSVCFNEGVCTWSLKVSQVMGGRLNKRYFARVPELSKDVGNVWDDEAARRGLQGSDVALAVLEKFAASFVSLAMSVASLNSKGGVKPTRITLRSLTLYSAASLAFFFLWVWVSNQKHLRCTSVFALA